MEKNTSDLGKLCPTNRDFRNIENSPHAILPHVKAEVRHLAERYSFLHWHLAFPDVFRIPDEGQTAENEQAGWDCGFNAILGNPPWERVKLQEKEWFANRVPEIANASNAAQRRHLLTKLKDNEPALFGLFQIAQREAEGISHFLRDSTLLPLCGRGDVNTYAVFAKLNSQLVHLRGRVGCIVPSGIATDDTTKLFFQWLVRNRRISSLFDFENRERVLFPEVYYRMRFCLLTITGSAQASDVASKFCFFALRSEHVNDPTKVFELTTREISMLMPNTETCPVFRSRYDAELSLEIRRRIPAWKLINVAEQESDWDIAIRRVIDTNAQAESLIPIEHITSKRGTSGQFLKGGTPCLRLYEGKNIEILEHRFADTTTVQSAQRSGRSAEIRLRELQDANRIAVCRYLIRESELSERMTQWRFKWFVSYMDVASVTNERTVIGCILPWCAPSFSLRVVAASLGSPLENAALSANFGSFVFDFYVRQFLGGLHLSDYIMYQMPVLPRSTYLELTTWDQASLLSWCGSRVLELSYTAWDLEPFALDCGYDGPPFRWDEERRFLLRCELDAAYFHLYLGSPEEWGNDSPQLREMFPTPRHAVEYIMETFPIVKRKDIKRTAIIDDSGKITQPGTYITKDTILTIYDAMSEAIRQSGVGGQGTGKTQEQVSADGSRAGSNQSGTTPIAISSDPRPLTPDTSAYQTRLDPPPGPPVDAGGNFISVSQWDLSNWPAHIHPPRLVSQEGEVP